MPFTFNGFGTRYYGKRERAEDGSYVTTLWITALYIPLLPLSSHRVLPVGKGTNILIHRSQSYQTSRVPLCWTQVRNVYLIGSPLLLAILYFAWPDIQGWWKERATKETTQSVMESEAAPDQPSENAQVVTREPMSGEADSNAPCGKVIKLDKAAFKRLDLHNQLSKMVDNAGFTAQELEAIPATDLENEAFSSYSLAYLTWDKSDNLSRASVDKMIQKSVGSVMLSLSATEKPQVEAWTNKFTGMMLKAFELGRFDATRKPWPY